MYYTMLSKDEKAYLNMLKAKRDSKQKQINNLQLELSKIIIEIQKLESGTWESPFVQTELSWEEVNSM